MIDSVAALIRKGNKYLLIKREDNGLWEIPGGKVEKGELLCTAMEREVKEETGLTVKEFKRALLWKILNRDIAVYKASVCGKITPSWETPEVKYIEKNKLPKHIQALIEDCKHKKEAKVRCIEFKTIVKYLWGIV